MDNLETKIVQASMSQIFIVVLKSPQPQKSEQKTQRFLARFYLNLPQNLRVNFIISDSRNSKIFEGNMEAFEIERKFI